MRTEATRRGHRIMRVLLLAVLSTSLAGCFYPPPGPGFCYYHPYRCR